MDSGAAVLVLLSVLVLCRGEEQIKTVTGSDVTFKINLEVPYMEINWFIDNNRIVDLVQGSDPDYYRWQDRVDVDFVKKTLTLKNVKPADSGLYKGVLVDMGKLSSSTFNLQVYDHVCQVEIISTTAGDNVTLSCVCVIPGAAPTKYEWYSENPTRVTETQTITVVKKEVEQKLKCVASNEVSNSTATFIVPPKIPEKRSNTGAIICGILIPLIIIITGIVLYKYRHRCKGAPNSVDKEESKKLNNVITGDASVRKDCESLTPRGHVDLKLFSNEASEITVRKDEKFLMGITLHSPSLPLERLIVQPQMLTIIELEEGDYGTYTAETLSSTVETDTKVFHARESAQNGDIRPEDESDDGAELVNPIDGELNLQIRNAVKVTWEKDGEQLLTVIYTSDPALHGLTLYRGALRVPLMSGDNDKYQVHVRQSNNKSGLYDFRVNVIDVHKKQQEKRETEVKICRSVNFTPRIGDDTSVDITLCPVNVEKAKKITWKKHEKILAQWEKPKDPQYPIENKATLDPASGNLTLKNLQENDKGKYIMEAETERTIVQKFSLAINPITDS